MPTPRCAYAALRLRSSTRPAPEPQLLAAQSRHGDVRLAAVTQLATAADPSSTIIEALAAALGSEHADLRLRAAVALAKVNDVRGVEVLGGFLRTEEHTSKALDALIGLAGNHPADHGSSAAAAAEVVANRLDDDPDRTANRHALLGALGTLGQARGAAPIVRLLTQVPTGKEGEIGQIAVPAIMALRSILRDRTSKPRASPMAARGAATSSPSSSRRGREVRCGGADGIATTLGDSTIGAGDPAAKLVGDRVPEVGSRRRRHSPARRVRPVRRWSRSKPRCGVAGASSCSRRHSVSRHAVAPRRSSRSSS
jgi:hypothetical protein